MKHLYLFAVVFLVGLLGITPFSFASNPVCKHSLTKEQAIEYASIKGWSTPATIRHNLSKLKEWAGPDYQINGVFGPDSVMWEVSKVPYLLLYAQMELSMQLAHPSGAQGVYRHSALMHEPIRRFQRTFNYIWSMTYGTFDQAEDMAWKLHHGHSFVNGYMEDSGGYYKKGEAYSANDPNALLAVNISHWYGVKKLYETLVKPLTVEEYERFVVDTKKFGMLMGIPEGMNPSTVAEFEAYLARWETSDEFEYTPTAKAMEKHFREMAAEQERKNPVVRLVRMYSDAITASTLPPRLARELGLSGGPVKRAAYATAIKTLPMAYQALPEFLKTLPMYRSAIARVKGERPSPLRDYAQELMVGRRSKHPRRIAGDLAVESVIEMLTVIYYRL